MVTAVVAGAAGLVAWAAPLAAYRRRDDRAVRRRGWRDHPVRAGRGEAAGSRGLAPWRFGNDRGWHRGEPAVAFGSSTVAHRRAVRKAVVPHTERQRDELACPVAYALVRLAVADIQWQPVPVAKLIEPICHALAPAHPQPSLPTPVFRPSLADRMRPNPDMAYDAVRWTWRSRRRWELVARRSAQVKTDRIRWRSMRQANREDRPDFRRQR